MSDQPQEEADGVDVDDVNIFLSETWGDRVRALQVGTERAVVEMSLREHDLRPGGVVSGPSQFEVADSALYVLVFGALRRVEPMALTSELSIRFLRPAMGEVIRARATVERVSRRSLVGTVHVWMDDDERVVTATAQGTYVLP